MAGRTCDECGQRLVTQRRGARFCDQTCRAAWHNRERRGSGPTAKRIEAARGRNGGSRRASRDGSGTRIYLLPAQLEALSHSRLAPGVDAEAWRSAQKKLGAAQRRLG
jgi:hypothetical protein